MSGLLFVFKFLLCNKLENVSKLDYSEVGPRIQLMETSEIVLTKH